MDMGKETIITKGCKIIIIIIMGGGGRMPIGIIICRRMKVGITIRITVSVTVQITTSKRAVTSGPAVGKWGRQTHGQAHKMFFTHTTA
jgi:hypothetical protein